MFQIESTIFFQPGRIVIIIWKAVTFRIEHHFVLVLLLVFTGKIQSQRIQTGQPAESQQIYRLTVRRLFDLEIFQNIGYRLVIGRTGYDDIRIIRMLQHGMDDPVGNYCLQKSCFACSRRSVNCKNIATARFCIHGKRLTLGNRQRELATHLCPMGSIAIDLLFFRYR